MVGIIQPLFIQHLFTLVHRIPHQQLKNLQHIVPLKRNGEQLLIKKIVTCVEDLKSVGHVAGQGTFGVFMGINLTVRTAQMGNALIVMVQEK